MSYYDIRVSHAEHNALKSIITNGTVMALLDDKQRFALVRIVDEWDRQDEAWEYQRQMSANPVDRRESERDIDD